ncbi:hypothetical protein AALP_AA4G210600 [Arabis alpina]|uniref:Uncharacterized protein n=1 Tax=Arabis alpina TaxID=50452 RepID=A0A087H4N1_ARAAL|nr:hypothetical protein AALP_AA4G210600 [Arabis alpina]
MLMTAEFNLLGNRNPSFMLHFKPRFGDFEVRKSHSSSDLVKSVNGSVIEKESSIEVVDFPTVNGFRTGDIAGLISGVDVAARTSMNLRGNAVVNFRWGIRVPKEFNPTDVISLKKIPFLVMNKIGIEHVYGKDTKLGNNPGRVSGLGLTGNADVAEMCLGVRRQMEELGKENLELKRSVEDLRRVITNVRPFSPESMEKRKTVDYGGKKHVAESDVAEELK